MKDGNYYTVYGWMINRLKLKGTTLQLYAVIYGFSENGENECSGSLAYLAETTGCTKQTVLNALNKLEKLGYILKRQTRDDDGGLRNHYRVNLTAIEQRVSPQKVGSGCGKNVETKAERPKKFTQPVKKTECPQPKKRNAPSQKTRPYNTTRESIGFELCEGDARSEKQTFGDFQNVQLTENEYARLSELYGTQLPQTISSLSSYMASTGKHYCNHYATLFRWCQQDIQKAKNQGQQHHGYRNPERASEWLSENREFLESLGGLY